jgi:hypothetical protein
MDRPATGESLMVLRIQRYIRTDYKLKKNTLSAEVSLNKEERKVMVKLIDNGMTKPAAIQSIFKEKMQ